ncbi:MAG: hypothetical protein HY722_09490 [Planctomycetes bacterium]|nr:hypothetical protein [Planctomycetota bacterium]
MEGRKPFLLRMDPRLWAELEAWARQELRSVNGQIEFLLAEAVRRRKGEGRPGGGTAGGGAAGGVTPSRSPSPRGRR